MEDVVNESNAWTIYIESALQKSNICSFSTIHIITDIYYDPETIPSKTPLQNLFY